MTNYAFQRLLHFIYLAVNLNEIFGPTPDLGDDLIASSHVVWENRPMWDPDYVFQ